jgi:type IV secretion system protein VirB10
MTEFPPAPDNDPDTDPRAGMAPDALAQASRNAFPVVAASARGRDRGGLLAGAAIALALGGLTFFTMHGRSENAEPLPEPSASAAPLPALSSPVAPAPTTTAATPPPPPPPTPAQQAAIDRLPGGGAVDPGGAPVMVYDTSAQDAPARAGGAAPGPVAGGPSGPQQQSLTETEAFGTRVGNAGVETASATRIADLSNTVTQGTLIPAVLETAIDSDLPGYVRAVVSQDVKSFDGRRVLIPRSSRLIGQYKSGLAAGQTRAYVMWTRLIRPDGVSVALASPGVEFNGQSGFSGKVDSHFFKRFGAATMLSVIGGLGALASSSAGVVISSSGSSAASVAAQRDAQIPPTVHVAQGQPIRVFTARDLDFAPVGR